MHGHTARCMLLCMVQGCVRHAALDECTMGMQLLCMLCILVHTTCQAQCSAGLHVAVLLQHNVSHHGGQADVFMAYMS